jgi:hypothetical protein
MNCEVVIQQIPLLLYGELSFEEEELMQQHMDVCGSCRSETERMKALHKSIDSAELEPDPVLLADCRRNLRIATSALFENGGPHRSAWSEFIGRMSPHGSAWNWFGKPVSAVTLIAMGFFGGRLVPPGGGALPVGRMALGDNPPVASRVRFVEPGNSGQVQIVLEETRQRVLSGDVEDEAIRTLLLRATRESSDPGVRVETMDLLKAQPQAADVKRALLHALRTDTNAGVRLKALEALRPSAEDSETRQALAEVLLKDENPGVRTQAIDLLTSKREPELVGVLQEIMTRENNNYVRMKCQRTLSEMNASVETF